MACEKCWNDAYLRCEFNGKSQAENYQELLKEREMNPCGPEWESENYFARLAKEHAAESVKD